MASRTCYFCGKPLRPVLIGGKTVLPAYCWKCGQEKERDPEFGPGWEKQPWAKFLFADVAREARDDDREAQHARLEDVDVSTAVHAPVADEDEKRQIDEHRQAIYVLFCSANLGARRIKRLMDKAGEDRSLWQIQEALRVAKAEGLRPDGEE